MCALVSTLAISVSIGLGSLMYAHRLLVVVEWVLCQSEWTCCCQWLLLDCHISPARRVGVRVSALLHRRKVSASLLIGWIFWWIFIFMVSLSMQDYSIVFHTPILSGAISASFTMFRVPLWCFSVSWFSRSSYVLVLPFFRVVVLYCWRHLLRQFFPLSLGFLTFTCISAHFFFFLPTSFLLLVAQKAHACWRNYLMRNQSVILETFFGQ